MEKLEIINPQVVSPEHEVKMLLEKMKGNTFSEQFVDYCVRIQEEFKRMDDKDLANQFYKIAFGLYVEKSSLFVLEIKREANSINARIGKDKVGDLVMFFSKMLHKLAKVGFINL